MTQIVGYGGLVMGFPVLLGPMQADLRASTAQVTLALTISTLIGALSAIPIGRWLDGHGARLAMVGGSTAGVLSIVAWSQVQSVTQLYAVFVVNGFALALSTYEAAFAVIVVATSARQRDSALLWLTIATAGVSAFYYPLTGWLESQLGWRETLLVLAAVTAVVAIPGHLWVVPDRRTHVVQIQRRTGARMGAALRDPRFWMLTGSFVAEAVANAAVGIQLVLYLREQGHSAQYAATIPMLTGLLSIPIRLCLGSFLRRFGAVNVTAAAFAVQGLGAVLLWSHGASAWLVALAITAHGFGNAVATLTRPAIYADRYGAAQFAGIVSITALLMGIARAAAPLGAAVLPGDTFLLWALAACVIATAALLAPWGPPAPHSVSPAPSTHPSHEETRYEHHHQRRDPADVAG